jgi:5-methylcytosine-specific restriction endonuclease McrA
MNISVQNSQLPSLPTRKTGIFFGKICAKCGGTEFYKNGKCKPCRIAASRKWQLEHPENAKAASQKWNDLHAKQRNADYYLENKEKEKARVAEYYANNKERIAKRIANSPRKPANLELRRITEHNRRARIKANGGKLSKDIASKLLVLQRGLCACCHIPLEKYHLDHIMPLALNGANDDGNIQLLCPVCNISKKDKHPIEFMQSRGFLL